MSDIFKGVSFAMSERMEDNLRDVLNYVLESEQQSFEDYITEHGEEAALENHIWQKALSLYLDCGFGPQE